MGTLNSPLLLVAASALITAIVTSIVETFVTNRQKNGLEQQLERSRHTHELEIEQLKHTHSLQLEQLASLLRLEADQARISIEQRQIKFPKAIEDLYKSRSLVLELITDLAVVHDADLHTIIRKADDLYAFVVGSAGDLFAIDDSKFRSLAARLLQMWQAFAYMVHSKVEFIAKEPSSEGLRLQLIDMIRGDYEGIKRVQNEMIQYAIDTIQLPDSNSSASIDVLNESRNLLATSNQTENPYKNHV